MEFIVSGKGTEISDRFRARVEEKLSKVEQYAPRAQRVEVRVVEHKNPSRADELKKVEITVIDKGPVIRAEAAAPDQASALDLASDKLFERLRRASERRRDRRRATRAAEREARPLDLTPEDVNVAPEEAAPEAPEKSIPDVEGEAVEHQVGDSPVIVRDKLYKANAMSVEEALDQMELVGHPFFLFIDEATTQPCVVYRRHGWTYGVLRLDALTQIGSDPTAE